MHIRSTISRAALLATATLMLSGIASQVQAAVVLDTFGPGDTSTGSNWSLYSNQNLAVSFTLTTESRIDSILSSITGAGDVTVGVMAYAGALPSNTLLYSTTVTNPQANLLINPTDWTLGAGSYWLTANAIGSFSGAWRGGGGTAANWVYGNSMNTGAWYSAGSSGAPAARISVTAVSAVPEPGTYALLLVGFAALAGVTARSRRRSHQG